MSRSRSRSPASVPPGSRSSSVSGPSASASSRAWVVLPEPSTPSSVTNTAAAVAQLELRERGLAAAWPSRSGRASSASSGPRLPRGSAPSCARPSSALPVPFVSDGGAVGLGFGLALLGLFLRLLALGALLAHLDHRRAVVVEAELPGAAAEALDLQPRASRRRSSSAPRAARARSRGPGSGPRERAGVRVDSGLSRF